MNIKRRSFLKMIAASIGATLAGTEVVDPPKISAKGFEFTNPILNLPVLTRRKEVIPRWPIADEIGDPIGHVEEGKLILDVPISQELIDDVEWETLQRYQFCPVEIHSAKTGELLTKHRGVVLLESSQYGKLKWTLTVSEVAEMTAIESIRSAYKEDLEVVVVFGMDYDTTISIHGHIASVLLFGSFDFDTMSYKVIGTMIKEVTE